VSELNVRIEAPKPLVPIVASILDGKPRFVAAHGGRASGKTFSICLALAARATQSRLFIVMIRATQSSIRESSKLEFETAIDHLNLPGWSFGAYETRHENGSRVIYRGLQDRTAPGVRSLAHADVAWLDEAQYIEDGPLRTLLPTIREEGSQIVFSLNPLDPEQCVYKDFVTDHAYPGMTLAAQANYDANDWLTQDMLAQIAAEKERDYERYQHEYLGHPLLLSAAQVFRMGADRDWHREDLDEHVPHNAVPLYGMDIGMGKHPSIALKVYQWGGIVYVARESVDYNLTHGSLAAFVGRLGIGNGDTVWSDHQTLPWHAAPDGWSLRHVRKQAGGEDAGVKWLKGKHMVIHPSCETTLYQLPRYALKVDANGNVLPEYDDHDDDAVDCIRYALHEMIYRGSPRPRRNLKFGIG